MELYIDHVTKKYGDKIALKDISLRLHPGIYGLLGPNGAGKSTLINIIVQLLSPTSGNVWFDGKDVAEMGRDYRSLLGYLPQSVGLYKNFTGRQMLSYLASLKGVPENQITGQVAQVLEKVNLTQDADRNIGRYSGGMRQRIGIAQALLGDPKILIFDEPTAGLDPKERIRFMNILSENASDRMILVATHIVSDVEQIAQSVLFLKQGHLVLQDRIQDAVNIAKDYTWSIVASHAEYEQFMLHNSVSRSVGLPDGRLQLSVVSRQQPCTQAVPAEPSLEDAYLYLFEVDTT